MKTRTLVLAAIALCAPAAVCAHDNRPEQLAALQLAVSKGDAQAMTRLAQKYEHAEGVEKDFQKATEFYCRAAKTGYAEAQFKLGWVYANGRGVPRDDGVAAALFAMAADRGHEHAARLLSYVRQQSEANLPACLLSDRRVPPGAEQTLDAAETVEGGLALRLDGCRSCPASSATP